MENKQKNKKQINKNAKVAKQTKKVKKKKSNKLGKVLLFLIIVLIALIGTIGYKTQQNGGGMTGLLITLVGNDEETLKDLEPIQVLLMGKSTDNGGKLTDTIIIGSYDPKNQKASLLSIPRDTFIGKNPKSGTGSDKINVLYQKSPERTIEKVNELTGLNIKYYMVIDNQALIDLVDIIGGVEFYVPDDMDYDDTSQDLHIHLKKGFQLLDGDKAEQLVRFRKNNDNTTYSGDHAKDDYGRMQTQREFIIETVKQTIQAKNILKIKDIIDLAYEYVETNLSISVVKDYVPYAINLDMSSIQSAVLPGGSYGPPTYPLWFFIADKNKISDLIDELYGTDEEVVEEDVEGEEAPIENKEPDNTTTVEVDKTETSQIKIEILNSSGSEKVLTEVKKALKDKGYDVTGKSTSTTISKTTIINKTNVDAKFTDDILQLLKVGNVSTSSVSSSDVDISIIIGKDYNK